MVSEIKNKNWFRRHLVLSIIFGIPLGLIVIGIIWGIFASLFGSNNSNIMGDVISENIDKQNKENSLIQETKGGSRDNPLSINTPIKITMEYGWWQEAEVELTITEVKRGGSAWNMIKGANMFNDKPAQGKEYLLAKIKIKVIETKDDEPYNVETSDFKMVSSKGVVYDSPSIVEPEPKLDGEVYSGGVIEGWESFEVDKSDLVSLLRIEGADENILWIKIDASSDNYESENNKDLIETNICNPNWKCSSWSECSSSGTQTRTCTDSNDCWTNSGKPSETQTCTYKVKEETETASSDSWLNSFNEALKELNESLSGVREQQSIYKKIDECTELCAGESIDIPVIKNECWYGCYQVYYYGGESGLDEYIAELKG